jgi:putative ABC transport system permease protein
VLRFAFRNLIRNRARSALALLGLAASTAGVVLLVAISLGARHMISDAMDMAKGVLVLKKDVPNPIFSRLPASLDAKLARVPGVTIVMPEIWAPAYRVEGQPTLARGVSNTLALLGTDPARRARLREGGLFARSLVEGRMFHTDEPDGAVISLKLATDLKKHVGETLDVMDHSLAVTGVFDTGTPIFDNMILAQEELVRSVAELSSASVSSYYLEIEKGEDPELVAARVRQVVPRSAEVKSTLAWGREVNTLVGNLDPYLAAVSFVAASIGGLGVVNTMLMSVRERVREIGVLRATGWQRADVFRLVLVEASLIGGLGGAVGALGGAAAAALAGHVLPIKPFASPSLVLASTGAAVVLGALGGLYPAVYAAALDPIGAIRGGA